jgi:hypothetical protein
VLNGDTADYLFQVKKFELYARQIDVIPSKTMSVVKQQALQPLKMYFSSIDSQSFTIAAGKTVENIRGIFPYCMPYQVFMVLVETDRINGQMKKYPYKFKQCPGYESGSYLKRTSSYDRFNYNGL